MVRGYGVSVVAARRHLYVSEDAAVVMDEAAAALAVDVGHPVSKIDAYSAIGIVGSRHRQEVLDELTSK